MRKLSIHELNRKSIEEFRQSEKSGLVLVLDNVRSMYNVGSIFRTADAFLVEKIWLCGFTACPPHPEIRKTALGATESVAWEHAAHIVDVIKQLKAAHYQIIAVEQTSASKKLHEYRPDKNEKTALILGNEVKGIQESVLALSDMALEIPQFGFKHSFNIAVCAGIVMYDWFVKRHV